MIWFRLDAGRADPRQQPRRAPLAEPSSSATAGARSRSPTATTRSAGSALQAVVEAVIDDVEVAREDIVALSVHYDDFSPESAARFRTQPRISFRLRIVGVHDHLDD